MEINDRFVLHNKPPPREGGMAEVYKAFDKENPDSGSVAVKLFKTLPQGELSRAAFARELEGLNELGSHDNIIDLIDFGTDESTKRQFIALEWCEDDLSSVVRNKRIESWDDFYEDYGRPILNALSFAFESRGCIHRDVKPANILLSSGNQVRVADFGISRYGEYSDLSRTFKMFGSQPYAPPERDSDVHEATKDVFGFAVVALECVIGRELADYPDLKRAIAKEVDLPQQVREIIQACLDDNPGKRPVNISELKDELEKIRREQGRYARKRRLNLVLSRNARDRIRQVASARERSSEEKYAFDDLRQGPFVEPFRILENDNLKVEPNTYRVYGETMTYVFAVDSSSGDHFVVTSAHQLESADYEKFSNRSWHPTDIEFHLGPPQNPSVAQANIEYFKENVADHFAQVEERRRKTDAEEIFQKWNSIIQCRQNIEFSKEDPLKFRFKSADGRRVVLIMDRPHDSGIVGQLRTIDTGKTRISGEIESVSSNELHFYVETGEVDDFPRQGMLALDTRASRAAIRRQQAALDDIRFGRAANSKAGELLLNPSKVLPPMPDGNLTFFDGELDEDKRNAVSAGIATDDFLVVEGPPGTGKTKLIAELILQHIHRNPNGRILLSSQTHVALDNALEHVRATSEERELNIGLVRIGRWNDERISHAVSDLLLETQVHTWLAEVNRGSDEFLAAWAKANGVSEDDVRIGIDLQRLSRALICRDQSRALVADLETKLFATKKLSSASSVQRDLDRFTKNTDDLQFLEDELEREKQLLTRNKKKFKEACDKLLEHSKLFGDEILGYTSADLNALATEFIGTDESSHMFRRLVDIQVDWLDRFGRSEDFYGAFVAGSHVVAGTCLGFSSRNLQDVSYDFCIIDEASKATANEVLVPLARSKKWIVVGDSRQLPPFVDVAAQNQKVVEEFDLCIDDIKQSIFDHLRIRLPPEKSLTLTKQYRMIAPIGNLISDCFYDGALESVRDERDTFLERSQAFVRPVTWFSTSTDQARREIPDGTSFINLAEVEVVKKLLMRIEFAAAARKQPYSVAVLAGYSTQVKELERMAARLSSEIPNLKVSCHTVDTYQGRQADIAIYSITRSNTKASIGFLGEKNRLNVALSRGRSALGIVGDDVFCRAIHGKNPFLNVLDYISAHPGDCAVYSGGESGVI